MNDLTDNHRFAFDTADVIAVVSVECPGGPIDPLTWDCPCGCGYAFVFGRNSRALWVGTTVSDVPRVQLVGLESEDEVRTFGRIVGATLEEPHASSFKVALLVAFRGTTGPLS